MEVVRFKTNIKCVGCIAKVTPFLNGNKGVKGWKVDTASPNRILTVEKEGISEDEIIAIVNKSGFKIEPMTK